MLWPGGTEEPTRTTHDDLDSLTGRGNRNVAHLDVYPSRGVGTLVAWLGLITGVV